MYLDMKILLKHSIRKRRFQGRMLGPVRTLSYVKPPDGKNQIYNFTAAAAVFQRLLPAPNKLTRFALKKNEHNIRSTLLRATAVV
jgi:hypothetical protein